MEAPGTLSALLGKKIKREEEEGAKPMLSVVSSSRAGTSGEEEAQFSTQSGMMITRPDRRTELLRKSFSARVEISNSSLQEAAELGGGEEQRKLVFFSDATDALIWASDRNLKYRGIRISIIMTPMQILSSVLLVSIRIVVNRGNNLPARPGAVFVKTESGYEVAPWPDQRDQVFAELLQLQRPRSPQYTGIAIPNRRIRHRMSMSRGDGLTLIVTVLPIRQLPSRDVERTAAVIRVSGSLY